MAKKQPHFVGVDVSSKKLHVAFTDADQVSEFDNDAAGHKTLVRFLKKRGQCCVVVEVTGTYGLDLALALHAAKRVDLHYINPVVAKAFAQTRLRRAKTDKVDAAMLARLGKAFHDELRPWRPPPQHALQLRALTRRILALTQERTREHNRARQPALLDVIKQDILEHVQQLDARIEALQKAAIAHCGKHPELQSMLELIVSVRGIAEVSGVRILGEYACLPEDLNAAQLTAQAGLDPRVRQSGMIDGQRHISKTGNKYLRAALHMPALNTVRHCPEVQAHFQHLIARGKKPLVAYTAIARKLLLCIHAMLRTRRRFDASKFSSAPSNLALTG